MFDLIWHLLASFTEDFHFNTDQHVFCIKPLLHRNGNRQTTFSFPNSDQSSDLNFLVEYYLFWLQFSWKFEKVKVFFEKPLQNRRPLQSPVCQSSPPPRGDGNCMLMMMVVIACYSIIIISANDDDKGGEIMTIVMLKMVMRVFDLFIARQGAWYDRGRGSSVRVFVYLFFININHQPFFPFYPKLKAWGILKLK